MKTIKNNFAILKYVYRFVPIMILFSIFYIIASVVLAVSKINIIAEAIELVTTGADIEILFRALFRFIIIIIITTFFRIFYNNYIRARYRVVYIKKMQQYLFSRVKNIDMENFDNPDFYDNYSRALRDGSYRGISVFEQTVNFVSAIATTIAIGAIIIVSDPLLIIIILLSSIINMLAVNKVNTKWYRWSKSVELDRRMYHYVNRTFYRQRFAGEIKTTPVSKLLIRKYQDAQENINKKYHKSFMGMVKYKVLNHFSKSFIEQGASFIYLGYRLFKGRITISAFTATLNAVLQFSSNFVNMVSFFVALRENSLYINDFLWLVNYEPKLEGKTGEVIERLNNLKISNLAFRYPETKNFNLKDINLEINIGDKIAIVGPNGGGKTTLTKLLLRFYNPEMGIIKADDLFYNDIDLKSLRDRYAIVFQDFHIYALTIGENILMRKLKSKEDEEIVWEALEKVGMKDKIAALPEGLSTQVTREFNRDGAVFSGGEVQRIVIARVFASNADIYILDEPTASLDPLSEERINKLILKNTDKTMIIIAHRLSTVVDADKIYLIDDGKIVEAGTHEQLLKLDKLYAKMFLTQKSLYEKH